MDGENLLLPIFRVHIGIDLTYEGIATLFSGECLVGSDQKIGIDLAYEGIATCYSVHLHLRKSGNNIHIVVKFVQKWQKNYPYDR